MESLLKDISVEQFTEALIKGNGFGYETIWLRNIFGKKFFSTEKNMTNYYHNICQYVMKNFFKEKGFEIINEVQFDEAGETSVSFESIQYDLDKYFDGYKNAYVIYENKEKIKICVSINKFGDREIYYKLYFTEKQDDSLLNEWIDFAKSHNFYKNKKIDADGNFLELSNVTWDDVILPQGTIDIIRSNVDEQFKYSELLKINKIPLKRGVILAGSPGCVLKDTKIKVRQISKEGNHIIHIE